MPAVTLKNEKDEDVEVAELAAENGVVLFLVPKADTRESCPHALFRPSASSPIAGCTTQACGFRDVYQEFSAVGYDVYCLSADTPSAQVKWQAKVRS